MNNKIISNNNSTSVTLNPGVSFPGVAEDVSKYSSIIITINSDVNGAENGLKIYFGSLATNMKLKYQYNYLKNENKTITLKVTDRFFKLTYTNGTVLQNQFSIQTYLIEEDINNNMTVDFTSNTLDLFGNLKTSAPYTLLDVLHLDSNKNYLLMDEKLLGGTSTYSNASVTMSVTNTSQYVIRQSRMYCQYQPGKSLCIRMTGVINKGSNTSNVTTQIGYFDNINGLFFEYSSLLMYVVLRNNSVDSKILQSSWNVDTLDGNGPSGITIDFTKNIIYYIEFAYLGVGYVKFGVYYDGKLYIAHIIRNIDLSTPYMQTPNLPVRYRIASSSGTGTSSGSMICTCASVQSEGGYNLQGSPFSAGMTTSGKTVASGSFGYLMSIRLADNMRKLVKLQSITILCTTTANTAFELYRCFAQTSSPITTNTGPSITPNYQNVNMYSMVQYDVDGLVGNFAPTGVLIYRGYFSDTVNIGLTNLTDINGPLYLTSGITDPTTLLFATDYYVLCVRNLSNGNNTYYASMNWVEI